MPTTITVSDESTAGTRYGSIRVEFLTDHITVRELIRERVYQEVKDYNAKRPGVFRGLVQPTDAEESINGWKLKQARMIDWQPQFEKACKAFAANKILILINDKQAESLDQPLTITPKSEVTFLKLMPLVGG